jgi:hypothetical protein
MMRCWRKTSDLTSVKKAMMLIERPEKRHVNTSNIRAKYLSIPGDKSP